MKYNIYINQQVLAETNLDIVDSAILDFLVFFCNSKSPKIEKQRVGEWTWINYAELLRQMPLLRIKSKGAITPRIKKIEEAGYVSTKQVGRKLFIIMNDKVDELFTKMNDTVHNDERSSNSLSLDRSRKRTNKEIYKDNKDKELAKQGFAGSDINELLKLFEELNPAKSYYGNKTQRAAMTRLVEKFGLEKMTSCVSALPGIITQKYSPTITSPVQLENKMGDLIAFLKKSKNNKLKIATI